MNVVSGRVKLECLNLTQDTDYQGQMTDDMDIQ